MLAKRGASVVSRVFQQSNRRMGGYGHAVPENLRAPSMDELPVPSGSWQSNYDAKQRKNNVTLAMGIAFSIFSLTVAKTSGLVYLNYSPPASLD